MKTKFNNSAKELTLENAINAYRYGIATKVNDGKHITLEIEGDCTDVKRSKE